MAKHGPVAAGANGITSGIALNTLVNETLEFIRRQLPGWRDDPERSEVDSEESLNGSLCDYLNYRARHDYPMAVFRHEEYQTGRRRIDLSVKTDDLILAGARKFTKYEPYLVIEGKRLPAPTKDREQEYVTGFAGVKGGLQRFKLGLHGASLEIAAMVAYVQDKDPDAWLVRINGWISSLDGTDCSPGCHWSSAEQIGDYRLIKRARVASGVSTHPRSSAISPEIKIHHFWVSMRKTRRRANKSTGI
jgi:hypothetical protein